VHNGEQFLWKMNGEGQVMWSFEGGAPSWGLWADGDHVAFVRTHGSNILAHSLRVFVKVHDAEGDYLYGGATVEGGKQDFLRVFPTAMGHDDEYGFAVAGFGDPSGPGGYDIFVERYEFVPGPASVGLLVLGGLGLSRHRRRR